MVPWPFRGKEAGQDGSVETGVRRGLNREVQSELGTVSLQNPSVSVHNVHFMVCSAPLMEKFLENLCGKGSLSVPPDRPFNFRSF